jgi:hypothetical protein
VAAVAITSISETWCTGHEQQSPICSGCLQAGHGESTLTRCTLRKHASSPASLVNDSRSGGVCLIGPANVTVEHCYVEVGGRGAMLDSDAGNMSDYWRQVLPTAVLSSWFVVWQRPSSSET